MVQYSPRAFFKLHKPYSSSTKKPTHYDTLGVSESATSEEIRNAYLKLSKQFHPDMNRGDENNLHDKFVEINDAYSVLSNSHSKFDYDFLLGNNNRNRYNTDFSKRSTYRPNSEHYESYDFFQGERGKNENANNSNDSFRGNHATFRKRNKHRSEKEQEHEWDVAEDAKAISDLRDKTYRFLGLFMFSFIIAFSYLRFTRDSRKNEKPDQ